MFDFLRREPSDGDLRLAGTSLFAGLSAGELRTVGNLCHTRTYLPGEVVFDEGEEGQALYVVCSGRVGICPSGAEGEWLAELGAGEFFGELALLDNAPRRAQARAIAECELAVLFRGDFERLMDSHARIASRIALQIARNLSQRLRDRVRP